MYDYDDLFFRYIETGSRRSAEAVVPVIRALTGATSVADFGCGRGAWLQVWRDHVAEIAGVDGPYVTADTLLIPPETFHAADLGSAIRLGRRFDLATSFEVGEHLPFEAAPAFLDNLCRHADLVAFSSAVPGQGGEHHVNEQPYDWWRDRFLERGYHLFDAIRPEILGNDAVEPWYRYNALLFVAEAAIPRLSDVVAARRVPDDAPVPDLSPPLYRLRKLLLKQLPVEQVDRLAVMKHRLVLARMRAAAALRAA